MKDIQPPEDIQNVMAKQMKAEREKHQTILEAEAHRQSVIARAEGDKNAKLLAAEVECDAVIAVTEGETKSRQLVYEAEAAGLQLLSEVGISQQALQLKQYEALKAVADGSSTKIFIPTDIAGGLAGAGAMGDAMVSGFQAPAPKKVVEPKKDPDPYV